jgi:hypothetical protein
LKQEAPVLGATPKLVPDYYRSSGGQGMFVFMGGFKLAFFKSSCKGGNADSRLETLFHPMDIWRKSAFPPYSLNTSDV